MILATLAAIALAAPAWGQTFVAYQNPTGLIGVQNFSDPLGMQFTVNASIYVTALGVFDSGADGLAGTLHAYLWSVNDQVTPLASMTFTSTSPGILDASGVDGSSRFLALATPLYLAPGDYVISADGFSASDPNANVAANQDKIWTTDSGGGLITFVSSPWSGTPGGYLQTGDGDPNSFAAGTFEFTAAVPEPGAYSLILGMAALGLVCWRRHASCRGSIVITTLPRAWPVSR